MKIRCVWEHNGNDSLLYAANFIGAFTRGPSLDAAIRKMPCEIQAYLKWKGESVPDTLEVEIIQQSSSELTISDADSDVLFDEEKDIEHVGILGVKIACLEIGAGFSDAVRSDT